MLHQPLALYVDEFRIDRELNVSFELGQRTIDNADVGCAGDE